MTRRLSRNLGTLYSAEVAAKALGVVIFGALAQRLGPETYGRLGWALSVVFLLNLIQEAGLAPYGAREATRDPSQLRTLAARIICVRVLLLIPLAALVFLAAGLVALAPSLTFAAGEGWLDDYDVAVAQAEAGVDVCAPTPHGGILY